MIFIKRSNRIIIANCKLSKNSEVLREIKSNITDSDVSFLGWSNNFLVISVKGLNYQIVLSNMAIILKETNSEKIIVPTCPIAKYIFNRYNDILTGRE